MIGECEGFEICIHGCSNAPPFRVEPGFLSLSVDCTQDLILTIEMVKRGLGGEIKHKEQCSFLFFPLSLSLWPLALGEARCHEDTQAAHAVRN